MITCDEDLAGQIYVGRSIGHCAMLEEDAMHLGTETDVSVHVLDKSGKKTQLRVIPIETWRRMGFDKDNLIYSRIRLSAANKGALRAIGRTPIIALNLGERNLWMNFLVVENLARRKDVKHSEKKRCHLFLEMDDVSDNRHYCTNVPSKSEGE